MKSVSTIPPFVLLLLTHFYFSIFLLPLYSKSAGTQTASRSSIIRTSLHHHTSSLSSTHDSHHVLLPLKKKKLHYKNYQLITYLYRINLGTLLKFTCEYIFLIIIRLFSFGVSLYFALVYQMGGNLQRYIIYKIKRELGKLKENKMKPK